MGKKALTCFFIILSALSAFGIYHIFSIRFKIGDVYPPYSSLRTDPVGTKIFFKSLAGMEGYNVKRDYDPFPKWEGNADTTLFVLGVKSNILESSDRETNRILSWIVSSGTRTIISFSSKNFIISSVTQKDEKSAKEKEEKDNSDKDENNTKKDIKTDYRLSKLWGVKLSRSKKSNTETSGLVQTGSDMDLPQSVKCRTTNYFTDLDERWKILYSLEDQPVIISRELGKGTIILCADSYIFSNEAMMYNRYPNLLSWFIGPGKHIYFDESHFGIQKTTGMIDLAYKYRLQGVMFAFFIIAGLYVWKNAISCVPPRNYDDEKSMVIMAERDYLDGLVSLLQRYIPAGELVKACIREWEQSSAHGRNSWRYSIHSATDLEQLAEKYREPSQMYNSISKKLTERKSL